MCCHWLWYGYTREKQGDEDHQVSYESNWPPPIFPSFENMTAAWGPRLNIGHSQWHAWFTPRLQRPLASSWCNHNRLGLLRELPFNFESLHCALSWSVRCSSLWWSFLVSFSSTLTQVGVTHILSRQSLYHGYTFTNSTKLLTGPPPGYMYVQLELPIIVRTTNEAITAGFGVLGSTYGALIV